ncbi:secretory calcium-binding phosphoprotein 9 [Nematolebias whitei]|uniref:secretory calcium-binding phosphoprotein 9 n=1 Tax=Nematolebias whitei TaxID=451745 RepID=UPI0018981FCE|nr:secretory calcium-binding phosphoprotein 9 [Nematolebias whitei]
MKLLLFTAFVATISYVSAGKTARLLAAMNAGMLNGMVAGGLNPALAAGGGVGFIGQPQFAQFVPGLPALALRPPIANMLPAAINAYQLPFMGVPQMAPPQQPQMGMAGGAMQQQFPMGLAGGAMQQQLPMGMMGGAMQQQPQMGVAGGAMQQQQLPAQPDALRRFRRQVVKSAGTGKSAVDTQLPAPTESATTQPPCDNNISSETN